MSYHLSDSVIGHKTRPHEILAKKHLLIVGGSVLDRKRLVNELKYTNDRETYHFSKGMKTFDEYIEFLRKHRLYGSQNTSKRYNINQILEFHWEWFRESNALLILEELTDFEFNWKLEILRNAVYALDQMKKQEHNVRLIITQEDENGILEQLSASLHVAEKERRTKLQIVMQNIALLNLDQSAEMK